jgi:Tfp pilus assembly protein FimV
VQVAAARAYPKVGAAAGRAHAAAQVAPAPLRLTRRGRAVLTLLALVVLLGGLRGGQAIADGPSRALEVTTYTVSAGETLWQIAADQAHPGEDVRDVIQELADLNGLPSTSLLAGQQLILPAHR